MKIIFKYLCHFVNTVLGMYQRNYSEDWDKELNNLLDSFEEAKLNLYVTDSSFYTIELSKEGVVTPVWVANKYYCYSHKYIEDNYLNKENEFRPKFKTMLRLECLVDHLITTENNTYRRNSKC